MAPTEIKETQSKIPESKDEITKTKSHQSEDPSDAHKSQSTQNTQVSQEPQGSKQSQEPQGSKQSQEPQGSKQSQKQQGTSRTNQSPEPTVAKKDLVKSRMKLNDLTSSSESVTYTRRSKKYATKRSHQPRPLSRKYIVLSSDEEIIEAYDRHDCSGPRSRSRGRRRRSKSRRSSRRRR